MKKVTLSIALGACLLLGMHVAKAAAQLRILSKTNEGSICRALIGQWSGDGTVKNAFATCQYHGEGNVDQPDDFTLNIQLVRTSGSFLCPKAQEIIVLGHCDHGDITAGNDQLMLNGTINGNTAELSGKLLKPVSANIEMSIQKK